MGTRSRIGLRNDDGTVRSIYTHWDGYPRHHGPILLQHYNTPEKVTELLDLGDLSVLAPEIGEKQNFDARVDKRVMCLAYGRDRGEKDCKAAKSSTVGAFELMANDCWAEYLYLFDGFEWWVSEGYGTWELLSLIIEGLTSKEPNE